MMVRKQIKQQSVHSQKQLIVTISIGAAILILSLFIAQIVDAYGQVHCGRDDFGACDLASGLWYTYLAYAFRFLFAIAGLSILIYGFVKLAKSKSKK